MAAGMKKAKIPAGIRRGSQPARSPQRDDDEPEARERARARRRNGVAGPAA